MPCRGPIDRPRSRTASGRSPAEGGTGPVARAGARSHSPIENKPVGRPGQHFELRPGQNGSMTDSSESAELPRTARRRRQRARPKLPKQARTAAATSDPDPVPKTAPRGGQRAASNAAAKSAPKAAPRSTAKAAAKSAPRTAPESTAKSTGTSAAGTANQPARARASSGRSRGTGDGGRDRGLRDLVGAGPSQVSLSRAARARDVNRPTDADRAAAEADLVIVHRNWRPDS